MQKPFASLNLPVLAATTLWICAFRVMTAGTFSPLQESWIKKTDFPASSRNFGLGFSIDGKGYFGMGHKQTKPFVYKTYNDLWQYDPASDSWTQKSDFPGPGRLMARGFSVNKKIYVGFGYVIAASGPNAGGNDYQTDMYEYEPATNKWQKKADSYLGRGDIFFVVGEKMYSVNPEYRALNKYNQTTDTWFESKWGKSIPAPSHQHISGDNICFSSGEKEYLITAVRKKDKVLNQLWELDPNSMAWKQMKDLPLPGNDTLQTFSTDKKSFAIRGGNELLEYDVAGDAWIVKNNIPSEHKDFHPAFSIGEKIYGFSKFEFREFTP